MTKKEVRVTVVSFEEYSEYDFVDLSTFFFKDAMGNRHYCHTSKRAEAQRIAHVGNVRRDYGRDIVTWSPEFARIYGLDPDGHMTGAEFEALAKRRTAEYRALAKEAGLVQQQSSQ